MRRDDPDAYRVGPPVELPADPRAVIEALTPVVTSARRARIDEVVARRTRSVVPVLERLTDPHNGSAVLRSADAFGLQDVHVVPADDGFQAAHRVSKGAHRWLDVHSHRSSEACLAHLRALGYEVVVAAMGGELTPEDLAARSRVAVVFGNEHAGVDEVMRGGADGTCAVPMRGFVESLNVSVAAAVTLYGATRGRSGDLDPAERAVLTARFLLWSVRDGERIVREYERSA